jgi:hypothetical protein
MNAFRDKVTNCWGSMQFSWMPGLGPEGVRTPPARRAQAAERCRGMDANPPRGVVWTARVVPAMGVPKLSSFGAIVGRAFNSRSGDVADTGAFLDARFAQGGITCAPMI